MKKTFAKIIFILLAFLHVGFNGFSQPNYGKTDYEKKLIKYLYLCYSVTDSKFSMIVDRIEPVYNDGKLNAMVVYYVNTGNGPFAGMLYDYVIVKPDHFVITKFDGIDSNGFLNINGNNSNLGFRTMRAVVQESQDSKIVTLNLQGFDFHDKYISKTSFVGFYDDNDDLIRVVEKVFAGKGKDWQKVKFDSEFVKFEAFIERNSNGFKVSSKEYDIIFGKIITTPLIKEKTIVFAMDGNMSNLEINGDKVVSKFDAGRLVEVQYSNKLMEYEYDENGFLKILRTIEKDKDSNKKFKSAELFYDYELIPKRPVGLWDSYKPTKRSLEYDSNGVAIKERKPGFVRTKEANDEWGAWTQSRY